VSTIQPVGAHAFLARYEGLKERLAGDLTVREAAAARFAETGLPGLRDEAWKYTSLRPIAQAAFHEPLTFLAS
jgi:Fe-S cluster assembly protein SufD